MNLGEVRKYIEELYPGFTVEGNKTIFCRNSRIFMLDLCKGLNRDRIVVKISRNYQPREVALEYANLSRFYNSRKEESISSPRPIFVDAENGILVMSHVHGVNLSHMLHEIRPVSSQYLRRAADLSGIALARYHVLFCREEGEPLVIDKNAHEDDINQFLAESRERINRCNLKTCVTPFFDFTSWNILINNDGIKSDRIESGGIENNPSKSMRLFLIDFPRYDYVCTPHLDLARFRFGLELIKQFPPAKFFGLNRWNVDSFYNRFLSSYCHQMQIDLNQDDLGLIARARIAYIRRAQNLKRKGRCGWQPKLEQIYLQTFSRKWLNQGDIFSKWPRIGLVKKA